MVRERERERRAERETKKKKKTVLVPRVSVPTNTPRPQEEREVICIYVGMAVCLAHTRVAKGWLLRVGCQGLVAKVWLPRVRYIPGAAQRC